MGIFSHKFTDSIGSFKSKLNPGRRGQPSNGQADEWGKSTYVVGRTFHGAAAADDDDRGELESERGAVVSLDEESVDGDDDGDEDDND